MASYTLTTTSNTSSAIVSFTPLGRWFAWGTMAQWHSRGEMITSDPHSDYIIVVSFAGGSLSYNALPRRRTVGGGVVEIGLGVEMDINI